VCDYVTSPGWRHHQVTWYPMPAIENSSKMKHARSHSCVVFSGTCLLFHPLVHLNIGQALLPVWDGQEGSSSCLSVCPSGICCRWLAVLSLYSDTGDAQECERRCLQYWPESHPVRCYSTNDRRNAVLQHWWIPASLCSVLSDQQFNWYSAQKIRR